MPARTIHPTDIKHSREAVGWDRWGGDAAVGRPWRRRRVSPDVSWVPPGEFLLSERHQYTLSSSSRLNPNRTRTSKVPHCQLRVQDNPNLSMTSASAELDLVRQLLLDWSKRPDLDFITHLVCTCTGYLRFGLMTKNWKMHENRDTLAMQFSQRMSETVWEDRSRRRRHSHLQTN